MNRLVKLLLIIAVIIGLAASTSQAKQEIRETKMLSRFLDENFTMIKKILRVSHEMKFQAEPFLKRRHRERYRFAPTDKYPRQILTYSRKMTARFKMINGMLYHAELPNRDLLFQQLNDSTDTLSTYGKRAIRSIKDNNYALYLASAQGVEKEVFHLNELLASLEEAINSTISESDNLKESL